MTDVPKTSRITDVAMPGKPASFGELLRQYRVAAGLSREALAERAGVSARGIQDLERGINRTPRADTVALLIRALALSPGEQGALEATISRSRRPSISAAVMIGSEHDQRPASAPPEPALVRGRFLGALPPFPLAGRTDEWQRLQVLIARVEQRDGQVVALAGEPGVGKTRLAQEITVELRNRAFLVAAGRCYEPQQGIPYYPFLDVVASAYHGASAALRAEVLRRWPAVTRFLPDSLPEDGIPRTANQEGQSRLFLAVTAFLQALAHEQPVGLLLDDVHWADGASLALLAHLARHGRSSRLLLAVTYRDTELSGTQPLGRILHDLQREQLIERIHLRPLDQDGTTALIASVLDGATVPGEFVSLLHRRTNGNAFFLQETLQALRERGELSQDDGRWHRPGREEIPIPESVRSAIRERLSRLRTDTRDMLIEASVCGPSFALDVVQQLHGRTEEQLEAALEDALRAGLIDELGGDRCVFNHALTQQALYLELSARRRTRLHRLAGQALETTASGMTPTGGGHPMAAELAWHFQAGEDRRRALVYALQAASQNYHAAAMFDAERYAGIARDLAQHLGDEAREAEALGILAGIVFLTAPYDETIALLHEVVARAEQSGNLGPAVRALAHLGMMYWSAGDVPRGKQECERAVQLAERLGETEELCLCLVQLAHNKIMLGEWSQAQADLERADRVASPACVWRPFLSFNRGRLSLFRGDVDDARRWFEDCVALGERMHTPMPMLYARWFLALVDFLEGHPAEALSQAETLVELSALPEDDRVVHLTMVAEIHLALGNEDTARSMVEECLAWLRAQRFVAGVIEALRVRGLVAARNADWEQGKLAYEEAVSLARGMPIPYAEARVLAAWAVLDAARGELKQARESLESALGIFQRLGAQRDAEMAGEALASLS